LDYWKYDWVLPVYRYEGLEPLLATLVEKVIAAAEAKMKALAERRRMIEVELTSLNRASQARTANCSRRIAWRTLITSLSL
jgi:hypothetical protein